MSESKRSYTKTSPYWNQRKSYNITSQPAPQIQQAEASAHFGFDGNDHYSAVAACGGGDANTNARGYRDTGAPTIRDSNAYRNLKSGLIPFEDNGGYSSVSSAIDLANRAYFNVAVVRNAINTMVDMSISKIEVESSNVIAKTFIKAWLKGINASRLQSQFYLEYYRSCNVFIYKFEGSFTNKRLTELKSITAAKADKNSFMDAPVNNPPPKSSIPIRYTILNPSQVYLQKAAINNNAFAKVLSTFEIQRLKVRATEEDKQIFNSLPPQIQESIDKGGTYTNLYIPLDQKRLFFAFNRKQDYEPMAVPMVFPILNDVEWKLELKKMDMALSRTIEQVLLLVTTGRPADQYNQPAGAKNQAILQDLFKNQSIGRVLVADYTTKAQWVIPDLKEILGTAKYERVDKDIKEGLQYVFFGEEKFANASIKARILVEGLEEGRRVFIEEFLQPEIGKVCEVMGFKNVPKVSLGKINIQDEAIMSKIYVQMASLGLLTYEELAKAIETGILPDSISSVLSQKEFKKLKEDGLYQGLMNNGDQGGLDGANSINNGRPAGTKTPTGTKKIGKIGKKAAASISEGNEMEMESSKFKVGALKLANATMTFCNIEEVVKSVICKHFKVKEMNQTQESLCQTIAKYIGINEFELVAGIDGASFDKKKCMDIAKKYISKPSIPSTEIMAKIESIMAEFEVSPWVGAIISKSLI